MEEKILDWKGNEVKAGMTIYFVQTRVNSMFGKFGFTFPKTGETIWESDEDYEKRKKKQENPIWHLGVPYSVETHFGELYYSTMPDEEGRTFGCPLRYEKKATIAIKGISDQEPETNTLINNQIF